MNNKELNTEMAARLNMPQRRMQEMIKEIAAVMADTMEESDTLTIQNFGTFEIKKKTERIMVNPTTKQRQLVPPRLAITFKPAGALKDKISKS